MAVPADHISENELIELANDALDEDRMDAVLGHIAKCDQCARLSSRIHKTAMFWDDWRERLAGFSEAPERRSAWWRARLSEVLAQLTAAPEDLADAAMEVIFLAGERGRILVESAASCVAPGSMDFAYSSPGQTVRAGTAQEASEDQGAFQTPGVQGQVALDSRRRRVSVALLESGSGARVLLIPFAANAAPILPGSQHSAEGLVTVEFENVPEGEFLLAILPPTA
jgi:hypothetical protein